MILVRLVALVAWNLVLGHALGAASSFKVPQKFMFSEYEKGFSLESRICKHISPLFSGRFLGCMFKRYVAMHIANLMTLGRFGRLCGAKPAMPSLSHASHSQCVALPLRGYPW